MNPTQSINMSQRSQRGAIFLTSLIFLMLMTVVSVSATKIASLDARMAGNNQQQMLVFQQTANTLKGFSNPVEVVAAIQEKGISQHWSKALKAKVETSVYAEREITNRDIHYPCKSKGEATSVGGNNAMRCYLFDLSAQDKLLKGGISDKHFRGVGKALPNNSSYQ